MSRLFDTSGYNKSLHSNNAITKPLFKFVYLFGGTRYIHLMNSISLFVLNFKEFVFSFEEFKAYIWELQDLFKATESLAL